MDRAPIVLLMCAQNVIIDRLTNTLSVIEVIDEISPPAYPFWFPKFTIASLFKKNPDESEDVYEANLIVKVNDKKS